MAYRDSTLKREHRKQWRTSKLIDKSCRNVEVLTQCLTILSYLMRRSEIR